MFRAKLTVAIVFLLVSSCMQLSGQDSSTLLAELNQVIGEHYVVSLKGKILIVDGYREGEQVKQDKVNVFDLDIETLGFSETEQAVIIRCYSEYEACVSRTLTRERKGKDYRNRLLFAVPADGSGSNIETAFRKLLVSLTA